jgi:hypothetical protein
MTPFRAMLLAAFGIATASVVVEAQTRFIAGTQGTRGTRSGAHHSAEPLSPFGQSCHASARLSGGRAIGDSNCANPFSSHPHAIVSVAPEPGFLHEATPVGPGPLGRHRGCWQLAPGSSWPPSSSWFGGD